VAGSLAFVAMVYAVSAVLSLLQRDYYHALISCLVLAVMVGLVIAVWLKSSSRLIPEWFRAGWFVLALALFFALFH
jgi:hypothetical protein